MLPGSTATLTAIITPDNASDREQAWSSSNPDVATVDRGTVTAVAEGPAVIRLALDDGDQTATCTVSVTSRQITMTSEWAGGVKIELAGSGPVAIDWGDGTTAVETLPAGISVFAHSYAENTSRTATITGGDITYIDCANNRLTTLDVRKNPALVELRCWNNRLKVLNVKNNPALTLLWCSSNLISLLDAAACTKLVTLYCYNNRISDLTIGNAADLHELICSDNRITSLNLRSCGKLVMLECKGNRLTGLDLENCTKLTTLNCVMNRLTALKLTGNTELVSLSCDINRIDELNVDTNTQLELLSCGFNQLTQLNLRSNTALRQISIRDNRFSDTQLDQTFETLHTGAVGRKTIQIGGNPGAGNCSISIASANGWEAINE
jgi:hypothetical protein